MLKRCSVKRFSKIYHSTQIRTNDLKQTNYLDGIDQRRGRIDGRLAQSVQTDGQEDGVLLEEYEHERIVGTQIDIVVSAVELEVSHYLSELSCFQRRLDTL